jgi:hypothetical protein
MIPKKKNGKHMRGWSLVFMFWVNGFTHELIALKQIIFY